MRARLAVYGVLAVIALTGVGLWVARPDAAPPPAAVAAATPTATPSPTPTPTPATPTTSPTPTAAPTPSEEPVPAGQTVLFRGGPATGPWQQIGSVAEITHPDAPTSASFSYREHWSDPEQENMPDWLWDQIVAEVAAKAVQLGPPADRVTFNGAPGSEAFNSFGGIHSADFDKRLVVAAWTAAYLDSDVAIDAYWPYLLTFDGEILERGPRWDHREDAYESIEESIAAFRNEVDAWSAPLIQSYVAEPQG